MESASKGFMLKIYEKEINIKMSKNIPIQAKKKSQSK